MANHRFKDVAALAEDRKSTVAETSKFLKDKGIAVIAGMYDSVLFESIFSIPSVADGGLSPRTGLGAVQALLRPLGVRVGVHDVARSQSLVLRKGSSNVVVRWQYQGAPKGHDVSQFHIRRFGADNAPSLYLLTTFIGPTGWVVSKKDLVKAQKQLDDLGASAKNDVFRIPNREDLHPDGDLVVRLSPSTAPYHLTSARQLGL